MRTMHSSREVAGERVESATDEFENMRQAALICFEGLGAAEDGGAESIAQLKQNHQTGIARLAKRIVDMDLVPYWYHHSGEVVDTRGAESQYLLFIRYCADFVALQYCNYIIYVARQIRHIAWGVTASLLMLIVVLNSYPLQAPLIVGRFVTVAFLFVGLIVVSVFAGMERNTILSLIARSKPGELNVEFWLQILAMGILPAIAVLTHLFPSVAAFLSSWVAPSLDAMH